MTEDQYRILRQFPLDKSWLDLKELDDILGNVEYKQLTEVYNDLHKHGWVEGGIPEPGLKITDKGISALYEYEKQKGFWNRLYENKPILFWIGIIVAVGTILSAVIAMLMMLWH